jgi:putative intracellular protease/amidase
VSSDLRKRKLYLQPATKKAANAAAAAAASPHKAAADGDAVAAWGGHAIGCLVQGGGVVQQVLKQAEGGGLVELLVTGVWACACAGTLCQESGRGGGSRAWVSVLPLALLQSKPLDTCTQQLTTTNRLGRPQPGAGTPACSAPVRPPWGS